MTKKLPTREEVVEDLSKCQMEGFILGLDRSKNRSDNLMSHVFRGSFNDVGEGMCRFAPYSFWRNNVSKGICKTCIKNVLKELETNQP